MKEILVSIPVLFPPDFLDDSKGARRTSGNKNLYVLVSGVARYKLFLSF